MVGHGTGGLDAELDDGVERVGKDDVDPLEGGHDGLIRRGEADGLGGQAHVRAPLSCRLVDG